MTLNGTNPISQGMVPMKVEGGYDMPSRGGEYLYNWGDVYEAVFGPNYTVWSPRIITVEF